MMLLQKKLLCLEIILKQDLKINHARNLSKQKSENCELVKHIVTIHELEKPFSCDICGKKFILKWRLSEQQIDYPSTTPSYPHYVNVMQYSPCTVYTTLYYNNLLLCTSLFYVQDCETILLYFIYFVKYTFENKNLNGGSTSM